MDLTISIESNRLTTTLFDKEQNLHLYLPPHSSHPRGVGTGLVFGQILRVRRLCSRKTDADLQISEFLEHLVERGHSREHLLPLFACAEENAVTYMSRSQTNRNSLKLEKSLASKRQIYLHLEFHPEDPSASALQRLWKDFVFEPKGEDQLPHMMNFDGETVGIDKLAGP